MLQHWAARGVLLTQAVFATQPNVAGIILAGSADFKTELSQSDLFDIRQACPKRLPLSRPGLLIISPTADCKQ